jgi:hypothetical protein
MIDRPNRRRFLFRSAQACAAAGLVVPELFKPQPKIFAMFRSAEPLTIPGKFCLGYSHNLQSFVWSLHHDASPVVRVARTFAGHNWTGEEPTIHEGEHIVEVRISPDEFISSQLLCAPMEIDVRLPNQAHPLSRARPVLVFERGDIALSRDRRIGMYPTSLARGLFPRNKDLATHDFY